MRITKVEAILLRPKGPIDTAIGDGSQDGVLVRVHTDEGITGPGRDRFVAVRCQGDHRCSALAQDMFRFGCPARRREPAGDRPALAEDVQGSLYFGRRGAAIHAISGVEIALWDIAGKAAGNPSTPCLRRPAQRVKAYASTLMPETPAEAARVIETQMQAGFQAVKLGWGPLGAARLRWTMP
jgi:L-alanine-DL-glutamate epimerase-like enolase superfamily enzyme